MNKIGKSLMPAFLVGIGYLGSLNPIEAQNSDSGFKFDWTGNVNYSEKGFNQSVELTPKFNFNRKERNFWFGPYLNLYMGNERQSEEFSEVSKSADKNSEESLPEKTKEITRVDYGFGLKSNIAIGKKSGLELKAGTIQKKTIGDVGGKKKVSDSEFVRGFSAGYNFYPEEKRMFLLGGYLEKFDNFYGGIKIGFSFGD